MDCRSNDTHVNVSSLLDPGTKPLKILQLGKFVN